MDCFVCTSYEAKDLAEEFLRPSEQSTGTGLQCFTGLQQAEVTGETRSRAG